MKDLRKLSDYEIKQFSVCESLAKNFLAIKQKTKSYNVEGYDIGSEPGGIDLNYRIPLTNEQVEALKTFILDSYNKQYPDKVVENWETFNQEVLECVDRQFYENLRNTPGAWDELISSPLEHENMIPNFIDFDNWEYCYFFSAYIYNDEKKEMAGPYEVCLHLSDDEYSFLLALQMSEKHGFTYNKLWEINPELAAKISRSVESEYMNPRIVLELQNAPFTVIFDEIIKDANSLEEEKKKRMLQLLTK